VTREPRRDAKGEGKPTREETSAGGVVFRREGGDTLFLVIRDSYQNWGFPKGHIEEGEAPERAALREVAEETGLKSLEMHSAIETIDWHFRFRGRAIHKVCHFFLVESFDARTRPQRNEGITACRWATFDEASRLLSYQNARSVLERGREILLGDDGESSPARQTG
jgi:8-oxo-dGTP pyrophosphatase MutT (NUDIX family)